MLNNWQTSLNNSVGNKLYDIKPNIRSSQTVVRNIRLEAVVLARIRIGHTRIAPSYLLNREEQPQCVGCDKHLTVRHMLLEFVTFLMLKINITMSIQLNNCLIMCILIMYYS